MVEVDELKNGVRREGIIYGSAMFFYKLSSAVFVALVTALMGVFGYVESGGDTIIQQSAGAIMGIRLLISCVPAMCFVLSAVFVRKLPLGKEAFDKIKQSVAEKG